MYRLLITRAPATRKKLSRGGTSLPVLALAVTLPLGMAGCGEGAQSAPVTEEGPMVTAAQPAGTQGAVSEPRAQDLIVPPPEHARFDAELSAAASEQMRVMGFVRRVGGTEGSWEGQDPEVFVYLTDRPFEEVHAYYMEAFGHLGPGGPYGPEQGEIEVQPLDAMSPDALEEMAGQHGMPQQFVDGVKRLHPQLQGRTARSAEFTLDDRGQPGRERQPGTYRDLTIGIMNPYVNFFAGELREQTGIGYVVVTMVPADGR